MSEQRPTDPSLRAALYVDGALEGAERESFEREMGSSPSLRAEVEAMRRVDASVGRSFGGLGERSVDFAPRPIPLHRRGWFRGTLAAGAAVAAVAFLVVNSWSVLFPPRGQSSVYQHLAEVYREYEQRGWPIEWVCETDEAFAEATAEGVGSPLVVAPAPGLELSGWSYSDYLTDLGIDADAMILIAEVRGEEVLVVVSPGEGPRFGDRRRDGLRVFRREAEGVTLYEVTPWDEPGVIDRFRAAPGALGAGRESDR